MMIWCSKCLILTYDDGEDASRKVSFADDPDQDPLDPGECGVGTTILCLRCALDQEPAELVEQEVR